MHSVISNLAYVHRSSDEYGIAIKASLPEILVAPDRGRAQIARIRKLHHTIALLPRTFSLPLRSCVLAFVNASEFLRRTGRRELGCPWCISRHEVQTPRACLVEEHRKTATKTGGDWRSSHVRLAKSTGLFYCKRHGQRRKRVGGSTTVVCRHCGTSLPDAGPALEPLAKDSTCRASAIPCLNYNLQHSHLYMPW